MKPMMIVGIVLIVLAAAGLAFQGISYTTRENVVDVAGIQISADTRKTIPVPLVVSGLVMAAGIAVVVVASKRQ
jgi:hypothetical protein